jgi:hypothetical protein
MHRGRTGAQKKKIINIKIITENQDLIRIKEK